MSYTTVQVHIYESQIQANFERSAGQDAEKVGAAAVRDSRERVHNRTGHLSSTITFGRRPVGRLRYEIRLNAGAVYAKYVEHGTEGVLLGPGEYRALKPYAAGGHPRTTVLTKRFLRGQRGQHFLEKGMNASLRAHGYAGLSEL